MDNDRLELLGQIAVWYYEDNLDQSVIAKRIGRSRSMVSRMLQEAREQGLVEIKVNYPLKTDAELEARLCQTFNLSQAWVLANAPSDDYDMLLRLLGRLGARCLYEKLSDGIKIGIAWSTALYQVVRAMPSVQLAESLIIQISGVVGHSDPQVDGPELVRLLSQKLNATCRFLHAPLVVENEAVAESLLQERSIANTLALAGQIDVALIGIGTVDPTLSTLRRAGYLTEADLTALQQAGAVGDVLARHLDAYGQSIDIPLNRRIIGQNLDVLRTIPTVIAVAGNVIKAPAILAALRGDFINVLITDAVSAATVLEMHANGLTA